MLSLTDVALVIGLGQSTNLKMSHVEWCPNAPLQSINGNEERYHLLQCVTTDSVKRYCNNVANRFHITNTQSGVDRREGSQLCVIVL